MTSHADAAPAPSAPSASSAGTRRPLRVAVASHREIVTRGLVAVLADYPERVAVGVAPSVRSIGPGADVVLFDLDLLDECGPTVLMELVRSAAGCVIGIADVADAVHRHHLDQYGLAGCLPLDTRAEALLAAVLTVGAGRPLTGPAEHGPLTPREVEILLLIAEGLSNDEIARKLFVSHNTLKSHIRRAYRKIGVATRAQAVAWAAHHGMS
jgi:DNA-binding NarL/FixJ family response regulator